MDPKLTKGRAEGVNSASFLKEAADTATQKTDLRKRRPTLSIRKPERQPHIYFMVEPPKGTGTDEIQSSFGRESKD